MSYKDFTVKAKIAEQEFIEARLINIGAELIGIDLQTDHYFKVARGKLKCGKVLLKT